MELTDEQRQAFAQQKQHCPFCQMIEGKIPTHKVYEDEYILAILDIAPAAKGHVIVLTKEHYPIMPFVPEKDFIHLFSRARELSEYLRKAMLAAHVTTFVATGAAAGQTSQHVMIHLIPSDRPLNTFILPTKKHDAQALEQATNLLANNLPIMMRKRSPLFPMQQAQPSDLAQMIQEHPELKEAIINNPDGVLAGLEENPSLKPVFEGVNLHELSTQLKALEDGKPQPVIATPPQPVVEQPAREPVISSPQQPAVNQPPQAAQLDEGELVAFIEAKTSLKEYLLEDIEGLEHAIPNQPRLQAFFQGSSPREVRDRYLAAQDKRPPARFGGLQ